MSDMEVSVIIVFRNEERHILSCVNSVIGQFPDHKGWELILVDGNSEDNSVKLVKEQLDAGNINYRLLNNPGKTLSKGWNIGIKHASGRFIIRPDAHATLEPGYISKALLLLKNMPEVGVVGGILETRAYSFSGRLIREALSMRSGVGNSSFRTSESSGYKDTAVYGLYRKEVFDRVGLMNEKLIRHQDTEFHYRVLRGGFKIYMCNEMKAVYFCRDSFRALGNQMYNIGYYFSFLIEEKAADAMRFRHWIPMIFYLGLFVLLISGIWIHFTMKLFLLIYLLYIGVIFLESLLRLLKNKSMSSITSVFIIPFMHFNYALGTLFGLIRLAVNK